jgi:hypothetical protein
VGRCAALQVFSLIFGVLIVGAECDVEAILKQVAILKKFWGKGLFFLYLGVPWVLQGPEGSDSGSGSKSGSKGGGDGGVAMMQEHAAFIMFVIGIVLVANGVTQFIWSVTVRAHPASFLSGE